MMPNEHLTTLVSCYTMSFISKKSYVCDVTGVSKVGNKKSSPPPQIMLNGLRWEIYIIAACIIYFIYILSYKLRVFNKNMPNIDYN